MQDAKKQPFIKKAAPVGLGSLRSIAAYVTNGSDAEQTGHSQL